MHALSHEAFMFFYAFLPTFQFQMAKLRLMKILKSKLVNREQGFNPSLLGSEASAAYVIQALLNGEINYRASSTVSSANSLPCPESCSYWEQ